MKLLSRALLFFFTINILHSAENIENGSIALVEASGETSNSLIIFISGNRAKELFEFLEKTPQSHKNGHFINSKDNKTTCSGVKEQYKETFYSCAITKNL